MIERDRDDAGRAQNARPRDELGRPLPLGSVGIDRIPDDLELPPAETLIFAQRLLDDGLAFNAHEVLEAAWKNGPFAERMLWQGLAQLAVGITHIQRGNVKGARTLLARSAQRLAASGESDAARVGAETPRTGAAAKADSPSEHNTSADTAAPYRIDRPGLTAYAEALLAALDSGATLTPDRLRPRLCRDDD